MKKIMLILSSLVALVASINLDARPMGRYLTKKTSTTSTTSATSTGSSTQTGSQEAKLIAANSAYKKAKTKEEKAAARKVVIAAATDVLKAASFSEKRSIRGELIGYYDEEKEAAKDILIDLQAKQAILAGMVNKLKTKKLSLENKGWFWNSIKSGKEEQHAKIVAKIKELEPSLNELDQAVREQSIIAGEIKFTKTRALALASLATVMTASGLYLYLGPVTAKSEYESFKKDPKTYIANRASSFKNWFGSLLSSSAKTAVSNEMLNTAGNELSQSLEDPGIIAKLGTNTYELAKGAAEMVKDVSAQIIVTGIAAKVVSTLYAYTEELQKLLADPNATPEQVEAQARKVQGAAQQVKVNQTQPKQAPQGQAKQPTK